VLFEVDELTGKASGCPAAEAFAVFGETAAQIAGAAVV
jgi:hypothetical protein